MRRRDLSACRLYGILDLAYVDVASALSTADALMEGGVDILQLRAKKHEPGEISQLAQKLLERTFARGVPLIINDHAAIARDVGAEGVHVGQDDLSIAAARSMIGDDGLVGQSTHSAEQALRAAQAGADYIGFGPLFATPTKPDYSPIGLDDIRRVHAANQLPIFCIGGIKLENLAAVLAAGARRVVIVSGLLQAADVAQYARAAKRLLDSTAEN